MNTLFTIFAILAMDVQFWSQPEIKPETLILRQWHYPCEAASRKKNLYTKFLPKNKEVVTNFLTLGFQRRMFSPIFGWGCLRTMAMETRKGVMEMRWCLWLWCCCVIFFYLGWVSWSGYYWILAECEARELPSNGELVELLLESWRKKNMMADKYGGWDFLEG
jgi:hypothetical protein